jgi:hypothetical protein
MVRSFRGGSLLGLALLLAAPATAQEITGQVLEGGRPVVGVMILVDGAETQTTDQDGKFTVAADAGDRKVSLALRGYRNLERTVTAVADQSVVADFVLEPMLQVSLANAPATLARGASGTVEVMVSNGGASDVALQAAGLNLYVAGKERSADFTIQPAAANAAVVKAGETLTLKFNVTPGAAAPTGQVALRASLFAFDTAAGTNLIANGSLETVDEEGTPEAWTFGIDNASLGIEAEGTIVADSRMTGNRSARVDVPVSPEGDVRAYWGPPGANWLDLKPGATYVLSGYVKTENVEAEQFGAAVYVPVVNDNPYQQPNAPWITGTRDWRKAIIRFSIAEDADGPRAVPRGEIQQATGIAWFDNFSLTEGTLDGSLTVTSPEQSLEVTGG